MGSKKPKKKKLNSRRVIKLSEVKKLKRKRSADSDLSFTKKMLRSNEINQNRLSDSNKCSRFNFNKKNNSKLNGFVEVREHYFSCLQSVVSENCVFCNSKPSVDELENLSLQLEQKALLASLQADIYIRSVSKIISDIEKCTQEKQAHEEVKKLLPESIPNKEIPPVNEKSSSSPSNQEIYSQIPIISNNRPNTDLSIYSYDEVGNPDYNSVSYQDFKFNAVNPSFTVSDQYLQNYGENEMNSYNSGEGSIISMDNTNYWCNENFQTSQADCSNLENVQNHSLADFHLPGPITSESYSDSKEKADTSMMMPSETPFGSAKVDPLVASLNQLQKSVEETLNNSERVYKQKNEEKERAYIAQILEGDDSSDDRFDSLSDNENGVKSNTDEQNLMSRLEKMRELFNVEETDRVTVAKEKPKPAPIVSKVNPQTRNRRPTIWKHEKVIRQYKFAMLSSEMTISQSFINKRIFLELFGEDSDEENCLQYRLEERYKVSCAERISSWVVKYLMPYYHDNRIVGRNIFKTLGHHISEVIVGKIQYPDEWTVKYYVSKFFPTRKKYVCDEDILEFKFN